MSGVKIHIYEGTAKEFYIFMRECVKCHSKIHPKKSVAARAVTDSYYRLVFLVGALTVHKWHGKTSTFGIMKNPQVV